MSTCVSACVAMSAYLDAPVPGLVQVWGSEPQTCISAAITHFSENSILSEFGILELRIVVICYIYKCCMSVVFSVNMSFVCVNHSLTYLLIVLCCFSF